MQKLMTGFIFALALLLSQGCTMHSQQAGAHGAGGKALLKDLGNGIYQDARTGLMWQGTRSRMLRSMDDAEKYAGTLKLGGYDDWRLPTIYELYELHYLFDLKLTGSAKMELSGHYWSGEKDGEGLVGSWEIGDQCGPSRQYFKYSKGYVRAVRSSSQGMKHANVR